MKQVMLKFCILTFIFLSNSCMNKTDKVKQMNEITAAEILGNANYPAICYGGYRTNSRRVQPTVKELKEDLLILHAMGIRIVRTYNVHLPHAVNVLKAIDELIKEQQDFEMYVMLGAWIDCKNAWTGFEPIHNEESERNETEIAHAVELAIKYPHIVKVIAVGNEAMVKWATAYYVEPNIILKWVNHLQDLKKQQKLPKDLWITSSDNFASWGGGETHYHIKDLNELIKAVDYISLHTYPMHDTHYNPTFWGIDSAELKLDSIQMYDKLIQRAVDYAKNQYYSVKNYAASLGVDKPIHIGETGWASFSSEMYGWEGTRACDEYKQALYYHKMRTWTANENISCFFFEAFDETWKDPANEGGSENHFGLFTVDAKAKYALWGIVDKGIFKEFKRGEYKIVKTHNGKIDSLMREVKLPAVKESLVY